MKYTRLIQGLQVAPSIVFNATYYLEISNAITIYCVSHFFQQRSNWLFGRYRKLTSLFAKILHS